jgi:hypothetical protein
MFFNELLYLHLNRHQLDTDTAARPALCTHAPMCKQAV